MPCEFGVAAPALGTADPVIAEAERAAGRSGSAPAHDRADTSVNMADALDIQIRALHCASGSQFRANAGENEDSLIHSFGTIYCKFNKTTRQDHNILKHISKITKQENEDNQRNAEDVGKNCFLLLLPSIAVAERAAGALARLRLPGSPTPSTCDRRGWENCWKLSLGSGSRDRRCRWLGIEGGLSTDMMLTTPRVATHRLHANSTLLSTMLCYSAVWLVIYYSTLKSVSSKRTSKR